MFGYLGEYWLCRGFGFHLGVGQARDAIALVFLRFTGTGPAPYVGAEIQLVPLRGDITKIDLDSVYSDDFNGDHGYVSEQSSDCQNIIDDIS